ncbi:MAG: sugar ABC transporter ATP-binding protein [Planctomycetaceae bacterium]|nr:sugar ABC transporter ATP-binding protein [Planctomycetaceae bacterium]
MISLVTRQPLLECRLMGMRFSGVSALEGVDFDLHPGEVHGLVGCNGAGKSTLMKILAGAHPDHEGSVLIDGGEISLSSPREAQACGIAMVYQELSGIGALSVAENLFLGRQPTRAGRIDWSGMRQQAQDFLREMAIDVDVRRRLDRFPLVIRQMVEIARGLHSGARVLILDEPTSALSPPETRRLFELIRQLTRNGVAIIFISHFLEDVLAICDRVTVLKDGRKVSTSRSDELTKTEVISRMLGREAGATGADLDEAVKLPARTTALPSFRVESLSREGEFRDVSFEVSPGECVGLYGFVGAGHQELAHAVAGAVGVDTGVVTLDDSFLPSGNVSAAVSRGVVLVAADRAKTLVRRSSIARNTTLAHLRRSMGAWLLRGREHAVVQPLLEQVGCRPARPELLAGNLSGGNQQKVVLAKWLLGPVRVLVLEEPTRGMDVGAKDEVMRLVAGLKKSGAAVVLASTEPELVLAHADRILVFARGCIAHEFVGEEVRKADLLRWA